MIAAAALHLLQDDAVQHHGQLTGANLPRRRAGAGRHWEAKDARFQALVPDGPAIFFPGQDLEAIAGAVAEDEPVAGQGVSGQRLLDQGTESVEALAEIDR